MKTAIVHDWLNGMRGGEKVLEALIELYPEATIYTLFCERVKISAAIGNCRIVTSWLDRVPGIYRHYRNLLPLFPSAVESFDLRDFELVISSSHAVAKSVRTPQALHVSYCHTPMRYLWDEEAGYAMQWHQRFALNAIRDRLRQWDRETARRVDHFIANSQFVRGRIRQYYGRESDVIYPPVDTRFYSPSGEISREDFYLAAGAMVSYKRFDLILEAFRKNGRRLLVAGGGAEFHRLQRLAGPNVRFLGWVSDAELRELYRRARAFVFAAREDFGIMPVEARSSGCPVIALAAGGVLETVRDGISGVLFETQQSDAIVQAIVRFESRSWSNEQVRAGVEEFSRERFKEQIRRFTAEKAERLIGQSGAPGSPGPSGKVAAETASVHRRT
jgi:glycosyltransferase involved in cell wall biosynthesis